MLPTPSPKCIVPPATTKMIRKVSNFDQTTTQNEETFRKGTLFGWERSMPKPSAKFKLSDRHLLAHHWRMGGI